MVDPRRELGEEIMETRMDSDSDPPYKWKGKADTMQEKGQRVDTEMGKRRGPEERKGGVMVTVERGGEGNEDLGMDHLNGGSKLGVRRDHCGEETIERRRDSDSDHPTWMGKVITM